MDQQKIPLSFHELQQLGRFFKVYIPKGKTKDQALQRLIKEDIIYDGSRKEEIDNLSMLWNEIKEVSKTFHTDLEQEIPLNSEELRWLGRTHGIDIPKTDTKEEILQKLYNEDDGLMRWSYRNERSKDLMVLWNKLKTAEKELIKKNEIDDRKQ
jgi:hypothetical protein